MSNKNQVFGLTKTTGDVQGEAIRYSMTDTGTFAALSPDMLDFSAWDALSDDQQQALRDDVRSGGFKGFCRKEGV
jgi:hypothetical protein